MTEPLLSVEDLTIKYQTRDADVTAVSNASFTMADGEYTGLVGESGCGKSTIAKAIMGGLDDNGYIDSGTITYNGTEIQDMSEQELNEEIRWKEISWIPQSSMNSLDPLQKIGDQAVEIANVHTDLSRAEALDEFREMFTTVGLPGDRIDDYPHQFSGGMQQRAIIALSLFLEPSIIIADEPTTALDVIMQDQIFEYLYKIRDETDASMLLITHDISLVFESCESMAVMHSGQVAETGSVERLYDSPRHPYLILLKQAFPDIRYPDNELATIDGTPPQVTDDADYCTFVDRCPWAVEDCGMREPKLETVPDSTENNGDSDHHAACFRKDEVHELYNDTAQQEGVIENE